jgi:2-haloacid dehalogenase
VEAFNLKPGECLMCAAHSGDLKAAAGNGLRTAFIARPEERPGVAESAPQTPVDWVARSTLDLAAQLEMIPCPSTGQSVTSVAHTE